MESKIFVPPERTPNFIDRLLSVSERIEEETREIGRQIREAIEQIRAGCVHDFHLDQRVVLPESEVKGVYILPRASRFGVQCLRCNKPDTFLYREACLHCFGGLALGGLEDRKKYLGEQQRNFRARLYSCGRCGFTAVADELIAE